MILQGDALTMLHTLPDASCQMCVTSPPYWCLRDYGHAGQIGLEDTPEVYVARMVEVFREVRRVLRDDGTLWLNLGDSYFGGDGRNRNCVGDGVGAGRTKGREAMNMVGTRPTRHDSIKPKDLCGIPWRVAFALQADGWYLRQDIIWHKPNPMPESVRDRCTKSHEYLFLLSKEARYYYDAEAVKEVSVSPTNNRPPAERGSEAYAAASGVNGNAQLFTRTNDGTRNRRSVWTIATRPYREAHFATFPPALVEPCILAGSRAGDTVLDPFLGSGTTAAVAATLGRECVGIELNPDYLPMIQRRMQRCQLGFMIDSDGGV